MTASEDAEAPRHGLRERKKQKTRRAILEAAFDLFEEQGYDGTTIAAIADRAEIAPRTFFAYFPTKEDLIYPEVEFLEADLTRRLAERSEEQSTFDVILEWLKALVGDDLKLVPAAFRRRRRPFIDVEPALHAYQRRLDWRVEAVLREAFARDLGSGPNDLVTRIVAAAAVATWEALDEAASHDDSIDAVEEFKLTVRFIEGGLAAIRPR
jgi:AcrR family transcriptional regulator